MSLTDLASVGSFISGVGVLVSLIFLYFQLRQVTAQVKQAERIQQAAVQLQRTDLIADISMREAEPTLAAAIDAGRTGSETMSRTEVLQFQNYALARFAISEDTFYQHRNGLLSDDAFARFSKLFGGAFGFPGVRVIWKRVRGAYGDEFVAFGDALCAHAKVSTADLDVLAHWKADLAAEKVAA